MPLSISARSEELQGINQRPVVESWSGNCNRRRKLLADFLIRPNTWGGSETAPYRRYGLNRATECRDRTLPQRRHLCCCLLRITAPCKALQIPRSQSPILGRSRERDLRQL